MFIHKKTVATHAVALLDLRHAAVFLLSCLIWLSMNAHPGYAAPAEPAFSASSRIAPYSPRHNRSKPLVAVVAENTFTELTDYVVPYGVLAESGVAQVFALATREGPVHMFPALRLEAQATITQFDARFPQGADYVIVPAVHRTDDPVLIAWVRQQADKGATVVGVCDGVWVLGNAGLLTGRKAVGHWYSFDDLARKFSDTQFVRNTRYLADGRVVTTTGVTASIPVSLALVEAIGGPERAAEVAQNFGVSDWDATHRSAGYKLNMRRALTFAGNWLARWSHEDINIPVSSGVDEVALALVADAWGRTGRSNVFSFSTMPGPVTTLRGLVLYPDKTPGAKREDRTVHLSGELPVRALDEALQAIRHAYGSATADYVALEIEYPRR